MTIITKTSVLFIIPKDEQLEKEFRKDHNLDEWVITQYTSCVIYTKSETLFVTNKEDT